MWQSGMQEREEMEIPQAGGLGAGLLEATGRELELSCLLV